MTTFVRFHESNEHEGESWDFWLQLTGNEDELGKFMRRLNASHNQADEVGYDFAFSFHPAEVESEEIVDKLVEYAKEGYMPAHNKVVGRFTCPDDLGVYADDLYKGGISVYFRD